MVRTPYAVIVGEVTGIPYQLVFSKEELDQVLTEIGFCEPIKIEYYE